MKIDPDASELGAHGVVRYYDAARPAARAGLRAVPVVGLGSAPLDDPRVAPRRSSSASTTS